MYHQAFKCRVTGSTSNTPLAAPKTPVWCEGNPGACTKGAKQMVYWNQNSGNNVVVTGWDQNGDPKSPAYNSKMGFSNGESSLIFFFVPPSWFKLKRALLLLGAQNDIFSGAPSGSGGSTSSTSGSGGGIGGTGSSPAAAANPNVATSSTSPAASPSPGTLNSNGGPTTPIPNKAPSCKKRKRRSVGADDISLMKKSNLADIPGHRRNARRNW